LAAAVPLVVARLAAAMSRLYMRCVAATQYADVFIRIWALASPDDDPAELDAEAEDWIPVAK
jgi:hypothetical protein